MRIRSVVILVFLLLFLVVVVQNTEVVSVRLLFWDLVMSRIILLGLSLAVGVVVGFLLGRPWQRREQYARTKRSTGKQRLEATRRYGTAGLTNGSTTPFVDETHDSRRTAQDESAPAHGLRNRGVADVSALVSHVIARKEQPLDLGSRSGEPLPLQSTHLDPAFRTVSRHGRDACREGDVPCRIRDRLGSGHGTAVRARPRVLAWPRSASGGGRLSEAESTWRWRTGSMRRRAGCAVRLPSAALS